jgi:sugar phosphate isomerase/epimerase
MTEPEIGLCLAAFADRSFLDALEALSALEISVVDLPTDSVFPMSHSRPEPDEVRRRLEDAGVRVACVSNSRDTQLLLGPHGPHTDGVLAGSPAAKIEHARRAARDAIEMGALLGAPCVRLMLGCPDYGRWLRWPGSEVDWSDNVAAFVDEAIPLAEEAADHGMQLCIEPHVKQVAFDTASLAACMAGVRDGDRDLGLCFDAANIAAIGYDPVGFLLTTGLVPAFVHAKDLERASSAEPPGRGWVRYGPQPPVRFRAVPWGELDWARIVTCLAEIGFTGPVLIEHEDVLVDPELGIAGAQRYLASLRMGGEAPRPPWW